jgi:hypothetical protein
MKQENQIEKFIELRIDGKSFDAIAKELHTSKQTLLEWNKEVKTRNAVDEGKTLKINSIVKHFTYKSSKGAYPIIPRWSNNTFVIHVYIGPNFNIFLEFNLFKKSEIIAFSVI